VAVLAACSSSSTTAPHFVPTPATTAEQQREYAPPGPPDDPWGPYIREAAQRYQFPDPWIRAVMHQESGDKEYRNGQLTTSVVGAIGLMQVMPETYAMLRDRYGLGPDPYYPRDNILAGTAYLRELYDRFGSPGFLAAYNAGPQRASDHMTSGRPLPAETANYVASIGPRIGVSATVLASYTVTAPDGSDALNRRALAIAMGTAPATQQASLTPAVDESTDLNRRALAAALGTAPASLAQPARVQQAALTPAADNTAALNRQALAAAGTPASPPPRQVASLAPAALPAAVDQTAALNRRTLAAAANTGPTTQVAMAPIADQSVDLNRRALTAAFASAQTYQPPAAASAPARAQQFAAAAPLPQAPTKIASAAPFVPAAATPVAASAVANFGTWGIQVGAFSNQSLAQAATDKVRARAHGQLDGTHVAMPMVTRGDGVVLYRARLVGLSADAANAVCNNLSRDQVSCIVVADNSV
jgi:hypothetical protein